ncbi:MAG: endonuclease/exonuclease/phosphatase family protein [Verrucomicrobiota bacterium]
MWHHRQLNFHLGKFLFAAVFLLCQSAGAQAPMIVNTNVTIRLLASNLSSGNNQRYETPGLNILKGLKPDVVAMQEFNVSNSFGINTTAAIRSMIDNAFGTNFVYYRESGKLIPNGVISRFPIMTNGFWDDPQLTDREFAWAKLDIPGTNFLYVVSVHLHGNGGPSSRAIEADVLKTRIQTDFPSNAFVALAGDMNIDSSTEAALTTFKSFLSDSPIPTDGFSNASTNLNTNEPRSERFDYVFPSFSLNSNRVATVIGSHTFTNGLVFDSDVYTPLSEVSPVALGDSHVFQMQHMAVVKDFRINYTITNFVTVPPPVLTLNSTNLIRWQGLSNVTYSVQASTNLPTFATVGSAVSTTTNLSFTNQLPGLNRFFRVVYP